MSDPKIMSPWWVNHILILKEQRDTYIYYWASLAGDLDGLDPTLLASEVISKLNKELESNTESNKETE